MQTQRESSKKKLAYNIKETLIVLHTTIVDPYINMLLKKIICLNVNIPQLAQLDSVGIKGHSFQLVSKCEHTHVRA